MDIKAVTIVLMIVVHDECYMKNDFSLKDNHRIF